MSRSIDCSIYNVMPTFRIDERLYFLHQKFQENKKIVAKNMIKENVKILEKFRGTYVARQKLEQLLELRYNLLIAELNEQETMLFGNVNKSPTPLVCTQVFDPFFAEQTYNILFNNPHTTIAEIDQVRRTYLGILAQAEEVFSKQVDTFIIEKNNIVANMLIALRKFDNQVVVFDDQTREKRNTLQKFYQNQIKEIMPKNNFCEIRTFIKKLEQLQKSFF